MYVRNVIFTTPLHAAYLEQYGWIPFYHIAGGASELESGGVTALLFV